MIKFVTIIEKVIKIQTSDFWQSAVKFYHVKREPIESLLKADCQLTEKTQILHLNHKTKILVILRFFENPAEDGVLIIYNFSNQKFASYDFGVPIKSNWSLRFNSDWKGYSEKFDDLPVLDMEVSQEEYDNLPYKGSVTIGAYSALIFGIK